MGNRPLQFTTWNVNEVPAILRGMIFDSGLITIYVNNGCVNDPEIVSQILHDAPRLLVQLGDWSSLHILR